MLAKQAEKKRKRVHSPAPSLEGEASPPVKRHQSSTHQPPGFWDELAALGPIFLTTRALKEFDRRDRLNQASVAVAVSPPSDISGVSLERYARQGGPSLTDLRGVCMKDIFTMTAAGLTCAIWTLCGDVTTRKLFIMCRKPNI